MPDSNPDWADRRDQEASSDRQTRRYAWIIIAFCPIYLLPMGLFDPGTFQVHIPSGISDPIFWTHYVIWVAIVVVLFSLFLLGRRWHWARALLRLLTK